MYALCEIYRLTANKIMSLALVTIARMYVFTVKVLIQRNVYTSMKLFYINGVFFY